MPPEFVAYMPYFVTGCSEQRLDAARKFFAKPGHSVDGTDANLSKVSDTITDCLNLREREGKLAALVAPRPRTDLLTWRVDECVRPQLIEFSHCRGVRVAGVALRHAANWVETYRMCEDVEITGVRVASTTYWNNDGMDLVNCRRVRVADCDIDAADDGICLKSEFNAAGLGWYRREPRWNSWERPGRIYSNS